MRPLKRGAIIDVYYTNWHEDRLPHLFVLWSDKVDTFGLNLHYMTKIYSKKYQVPKGKIGAVRWQITKRLPYAKKVMKELNSDWFDTASAKSTYNYLKVKHPRLIKNCYRHYKTKWIRVLKRYEEEGL